LYDQLIGVEDKDDLIDSSQHRYVTVFVNVHCRDLELRGSLRSSPL